MFYWCSIFYLSGNINDSVFVVIVFSFCFFKIFLPHLPLSVQCKELCFLQVFFLSFFFCLSLYFFFWSPSPMCPAFFELWMTPGCLTLFKKSLKNLFAALSMRTELARWGLHCRVAWAPLPRASGLFLWSVSFSSENSSCLHLERSVWGLYSVPREDEDGGHASQYLQGFFHFSLNPLLLLPPPDHPHPNPPIWTFCVVRVYL